MSNGVHLIGGGWDPGAVPTLYGPFLDEAGRRAADRLRRPGRGRWLAAVRPLGRRTADRPRRAGRSRCWCRSAGRSTSQALDDADGLLVCGGLTPGYAAAVSPVAGEIRAWLADRPYCGFSAGAVLAAQTAVTGGWLDDGRPVAPEDAAEDLEEVTTADRPGPGAVLGGRALRGQWGTLPRLLAACGATGVDGLALDENTRASWRQGSVEVAGSGHAYLVHRPSDAIQVRRFADGGRFEVTGP